MRVFFTTFLFVAMLAFNANAQTETAQTVFDSGVNNARAGKFEEALNDFQNALENQKISNKTPAALLAKINYNIGVCLYRLNRSTDAVFYLTNAIELSENKYRNAFYALAMAQGELENWQAAKDAFRTAINLQNGRDGESWFDLAMAYLRERDYKNAADAFQKAIRYKSVDRATAHNNLGVIFAYGGDWMAAENQFQKALTISDGTLQEALRNLKICRSQNVNQNPVARLELVTTKNQ